MMVATFCVAFAIYGYAQSAAASALGSVSEHSQTVSTLKAGPLVTVPAASIGGWAWHSGESSSVFDARLQENLKMLKSMPGAADAEYVHETHEVRVRFANAAPSADAVVQFAEKKVLKCKFETSN